MRVLVRLAPVRTWLELECESVAKLRELVEQHVYSAQQLRGCAITLCHRGVALTESSHALSKLGALESPVVVAHWEVPVEVTSQFAVGAEPARAAAGAAMAAAAADAGAEDEEDEDEDDVCRLCFAGADFDKLITPCKCTGTMRYVHVSCLNQWRLQSANPQSYVRCDQCSYIYQTRKTPLAPYLESKVVHTAISACALVLATAFGALVFGGIEQYFYKMVDWSPRWHGNPKLLRQLAGDRFDGLMAGLLVVSLAGMGMHLRLLLGRDQLTRHDTLRALIVTFAANGPRIFRIFAVIGVAHYVGYAYASAQHRVKLLSLKYGEVLVNAGSD